MADVRPDNESVHDDLDGVLFVLLQLDLLVQFVEAAVHSGPDIAGALGILKHLGVLALFAPDHRSHHLNPGPLRQCQHLIDDLVDGLLADLLAAVGAVGRTRSGPQQTEIVVDLRHGAHGGPGVFAGGFLVDGDSWAEALDIVHVRLVHLAQKHPGVGRKALHIPSLALGVDRVEGQRGFSAAGYTGHHHQLVPGDGDVDVFQVILPGAFDENMILHGDLSSFHDNIRRFTLGFALLGALIFTLTLVPVMSSMLLKKNVREKNNRFVHFINAKCSALFDLFYAHRKLTIGMATVIAGVGLWLFSFLGTEFLPQLNEGSIYIRATLPQSISLDESVTLANKMRKKLLTFPEVRQVLSQTGRPNDGTDATGFYNIEFHVDIYPEKEWESKLTKLELIDKMQEDLSIYPGIDFNFSQPITDNVEEAASGVKGSIAVKVFGKDLYESEKYAVQIDKILSTVQGIEDLGVIRNIGQPELRIELNERQLARYGVAKEDVQSIIEMAIGGKSASLLYEDERKFNIMVRYSEQFRQNEEEIGKILVPAMDGTMVPIKELADITTITGPLLIFRDNHARFCAVKFSVRGRDMGTAVAEAQKKVNASVHLPAGYSLKWTGDFENQQRATKRLAQVVPISIAIIFIILFILFSNARDAGLVLLNVPFAAVGGIVALLITQFNFSISAGIGFIALFGICIQNGVIMISDIKANLKLGSPLEKATKEGVRSRIRPVIMTAAMAAIGLMPAAMSHGIGSESQRPLAIVIIGGLIGATFFALFVFPLIVEVVYERMLYDKNGKLLQRRI